MELERPIMAQTTSVLTKPCRSKRKPLSILANGASKKRHAPLLLYFPLDSKVLRTPFRARVLQLIYEIARQELGNRIASVTVQASSDPDDLEQIKLLLTIWADLDKGEWQKADRAISKAVFEQEATWTEDERADYLNMIDFEILPLKI